MRITTSTTHPNQRAILPFAWCSVTDLAEVAEIYSALRRRLKLLGCPGFSLPVLTTWLLEFDQPGFEAEFKVVGPEIYVRIVVDPEIALQARLEARDDRTLAKAHHILAEALT